MFIKSQNNAAMNLGFCEAFFTISYQVSWLRKHILSIALHEHTLTIPHWSVVI